MSQGCGWRSGFVRWTPDLRGWRRSVLVGTLSWRNGNRRSSGGALGRPAPSFDSARLHAEGMAARRNPQFTLTTHSGHRGFRKAADQSDGSPASFASRKLPFAASHTRPGAAGHCYVSLADRWRSSMLKASHDFEQVVIRRYEGHVTRPCSHPKELASCSCHLAKP